MFVIVTKYLVPNGFSGITIFPFVFLKEKKYISHSTLIQHEKIHLKQQLELLIVLFFMWYFLEFLFRLWKYKDKHKAYQNISFEREAYANESQEGFLRQRKLWNFINYLKV
ncbi:hypothetical protein [Flavobacterium sp.]|uniref:hypothetical protein n=1 Tax=Flavobacterium sp. TaxID=239 RepID=UPI00261377FC|nr:hypothetical protein [Flavobacterium sp.]MDD3005310.1 hypothetical protein [Flavobacterium sp.]